MENILSDNLKLLAEKIDRPLYVVGGAVRNFLLKYPVNDIDICADVDLELFLKKAESSGFKISGVYKRTNTAKITDINGISYEFTRLREDVYQSGHIPISTEPTADLLKDAKRRDFKCNALYYDIALGKIIDLLGGIDDIGSRVLSTVTEPEKVFADDGLRILRLCRFSGTLNFTPDKDALNAAIDNIDNLDDLSPERIAAELNLCLTADGAYGNQSGHYDALKLLERTGALFKIIPELKDAKGLKQPSKHHKYDVLEHSLKAVYYAPQSIRLAALLHDVGKAAVYKKNGNFYNHDRAGEKICIDILTRLKLPKKTTSGVSRLTALHMYDLNGLTSEKKLRYFIAENHKYFNDLLLLKQADFSASQDSIEKSPIVLKWETVYKKMLAENVPFDFSMLDIDGRQLQEIGIFGKDIAKTLEFLLKTCINEPKLNNYEDLKKLTLKVN